MWVDAIVDHNRPIINGCDDSVVQVIQPQHGFACRGTSAASRPWLCALKFSLDTPLTQSILAVGTAKNAILGFGNNVF